MIEKQQQVLEEQLKEFDATLKEVKLKSQEKIAAA
jgi:histidinol dehydrogenase